MSSLSDFLMDVSIRLHTVLRDEVIPQIEAYSQRQFSWDETEHPREVAQHDGRLPGQFAPKNSGTALLSHPTQQPHALHRVSAPVAPRRLPERPERQESTTTNPRSVKTSGNPSSTSDSERRRELVEQHSDLIWKAVRTVMKDWTNVGRDIEEAESAANEALFVAAQKFDFDHGRPFASFAMDGMIQAVRNAFTKKRRGIQGKSVSSTGMESEVDNARGREPDVTQANMRTEHLQHLLSSLDADERKLIAAYINPEPGKTLSEIAEQFDMSRQTFMNHIGRVGDKLRTAMKSSLKDAELVPERYQRVRELIRTLDRIRLQNLVNQHVEHRLSVLRRSTGHSSSVRVA